MLRDDAICFLLASIDLSRDEPGLIINEVVDLEKAPSRLSGMLRIRLDESVHEPEKIERLVPILRSRLGRSPAEGLIGSGRGQWRWRKRRHSNGNGNG